MQLCVHSLVCIQILAYICKGGIMYIWNNLVYKSDLNSNKHSQIITHGIYIHIHTIKYLNFPVIT